MEIIHIPKIFQQYNAVPPTPLLTSDVLKEENEQWPDVQQGMSLALKEMRVDQVNKVNFGYFTEPDNSKNLSQHKLKLVPIKSGSSHWFDYKHHHEDLSPRKLRLSAFYNRLFYNWIYVSGSACCGEKSTELQVKVDREEESEAWRSCSSNYPGTNHSGEHGGE